MERPTTVDAEYQRLKSLAVPEDVLAREEELFDQRVEEFARLLKDDVAACLRNEAASDVAEQWVGAARAALANILEEAASDVSDSDELASAIAQVKNELGREYDKDLLLPPEDEIEAHTCELAQSVLANWLTLLQHAREDSGASEAPMRLNEYALPENKSLDELLEGTEAYGLDASTVADRFAEFRKSLKRQSRVIELAPELVIAAADGGWRLANSVRAAEQILHAPTFPGWRAALLGKSAAQWVAAASAALRIPETKREKKYEYRIDASGVAVLSAAEAVKGSRSIDIILIFSAFSILTGGFHVHAMLTMGDWDFWTEWKDRRLWVTVTPIMAITFPAAIQAMLWERLRIPFGATFVILGLIFAEWINRYFNFWGWTYFPMNYVWPAAMTPMAIWLDVVLLLTNSYILTAVVGGMGFGLLFFPTNFPMYAPLHIPVDYNGMVMSIADIQGYHYIKTGTPEYISMVEKGTPRTFGKDVVPVSALFSGLICILIYFIWHWFGRWYSTEKYVEQT